MDVHPGPGRQLPIHESAVTLMVELRDLVADAAKLFVQNHGFTRTGRNFVRQDELVRVVRFRPVGLGGFDIVFNLGIAGISEVLPKTDRWVVSCSAINLRPEGVPAVAWLRLTKGAYDEEVREHTKRVCESMADGFLLKFRDADEFYIWVRDSALELFRDPRADNEFRRLKLQPFNVVGPLELAGVYAAHLGKADDALMLQNAAIEFATARGIDWVPRIIANITAAGSRET